MKPLALALIFVSTVAIAAVQNEDGSVFLEADEAQYIVRVFNDMQEKIALQQMYIKELEGENKVIKQSHCVKW
jgi:hypothetical protein